MQGVRRSTKLVRNPFPRLSGGKPKFGADSVLVERNFLVKSSYLAKVSKQNFLICLNYLCAAVVKHPEGLLAIHNNRYMPPGSPFLIPRKAEYKV